MSLNQRVGYVFGITYVVVGLAGFFVTSGEVGFAAPDGQPLLFFEVNPLHNLVHLAVGLALAGGAAAGASPSKAVNMAIGAVLLLLGVVGFFIPLDSQVNILALNTADHFLHTFSGILLIGVAAAGTRRAVAT